MSRRCAFALEASGGKLQFGTEVVSAVDGSLAAVLGASPGASVAVAVMLDIFKLVPDGIAAVERKTHRDDPVLRPIPRRRCRTLQPRPRSRRRSVTPGKGACPRISGTSPASREQTDFGEGRCLSVTVFRIFMPSTGN